MVAGHRGWASSIGVGLLLASAGLAHAEVKVSENASRRFNQGVRYLTSQDPERYEKAYREFKAAYADSPSWKILGNLGIVAHELERDGEAIDAFKAYLERGGKELSAEERKQFAEDLEAVEAGYSTVTIQTSPDGAWILDERLPDTGAPVVNRYGPTSGQLELRIRSGHHRIRAELGGYETASWELSDQPGESSAHTFELSRPGEDREAVAPVEPRPEPRASDGGGSSGLRIGSYVALGLGAMGVGLGSWFLLDAYDKQDRADELYEQCEAAVPQCGSGPLQAPAQAADSAERSAFTRSNVTYAASGALIATGVVLFLVSSSGPSSDEAPSQSRQAHVVPWIGPDGVGLSGRF